MHRPAVIANGIRGGKVTVLGTILVKGHPDTAQVPVTRKRRVFPAFLTDQAPEKHEGGVTAKTEDDAQGQPGAVLSAADGVSKMS